MSAAAACAPTRRLGTTMLTFAARLPESPEETEARRGAAAEPRGRDVDVHPRLWQACAGSMRAVPPVGAAVYYFPQGHAEHAGGAAVDLRVPPFVPCRVAAVRLMADPDTDDVYARIRLVPLRAWEPVADVGDAALVKTDGSSRGGADGDGDAGGGQQQQPRPLSFAKTLTPSDANNGGGFSVPRFCALSIFPELDYSFSPPVQFVSARDVHGVEWTFRHIYRGTPRRHLLTTGWSNFVHNKKLQPGDSVVFVREEDGKVHIGLRRAKRVFCRRGGGGSNAGVAVAGPSDGKVPAEDVVEAARLAAAGQPFEVVHYPRASAPEFVVRAAAVKESMQAPWCPGLRFKMAFETEDLSRISWFMGTIAGVEPADPARWPQSPWRLLQVRVNK